MNTVRITVTDHGNPEHGIPSETWAEDWPTEEVPQHLAAWSEYITDTTPETVTIHVPECDVFHPITWKIPNPDA